MTRTQGFYQEEYDIAGSLADAAERANAAYNLSFAFSIAKTDFPKGQALLEEALDIWRTLGDRAGVARAAWALAYVHLDRVGATSADAEKAEALVREALEQHRALGNRFDVAWDLHTLGLVRLRLGDLAEAETHWREAAELFAAAQDSSGIVLVLSNFAEIAKAHGDREREATLVGAWTALSERTGVGLASLWGTTEGRTVAETVPPQHRQAFERGMTMKTDEAVAYALVTEPAKSA